MLFDYEYQDAIKWKKMKSQQSENVILVNYTIYHTSLTSIIPKLLTVTLKSSRNQKIPDQLSPFDPGEKEIHSRLKSCEEHFSSDSHSNQLRHPPLQLRTQLCTLRLTHLQLWMQNVETGQSEKTAPLLPECKAIERGITYADELVAGRTGDVVAKSEEIDKVQHIGEAEIKVEMQQYLRLQSEDMIVVDAGVASSENLRLGNNNFLVFGSNEERSDGLQRRQTLSELCSEGHSVIDAESKEDSFHFEAVSFGKVKYEVQVADACILVKTPSVKEERRREAGLLLKQVVINASQIYTHIPCLALTEML